MQNDTSAGVRCQDHTSPLRTLDPSVGGRDAVTGERGSQNSFHLVRSKRVARAVMVASTPRQPCIGSGRIKQEALGLKLVGLVVEHGIVVGQIDIRYQVSRGCVATSSDREAVSNLTGDCEGEHWSVSQNLLHSGFEIFGAVAIVYLVCQSLLHAWMVRKQLECPRECAGCGLVTGDDHRRDIVSRTPSISDSLTDRGS